MKDKQLWPYPEGFGDIEFLENTPARGDAYYDAANDRAIIVYHNRINVYSKRLENTTGKYARCFDVCDEVKRCKQN